uniref:BZIP domain-containing protein n=1 Tax=Peronospora matthiolae TaxID=2874970 RepID=A0AAV1TMS4_9STRA
MDSDDATAVKTKRASCPIRTRESANKSRLRRNARLATLMTDIAELKKKEQELQTLLLESFFRKKDPLYAAASLLLSSPLTMNQSRVDLHMLGNGRKKTEGDEIGGDTQVSDMTMLTLRPGKRRAVSSTLSTTASLTVCSSVFGVTVFTSCDGDAVVSGTIRSVGRVLHESSKSCGIEKYSLEVSKSLGRWWRRL